ncbi:MAG: hypothetical protein AB1592_18940 [Pseudomonadota bacterium]
MSLVFEKLTQVLTAGEQWVIGIVGDSVRVSASSYPVTVALYSGGREIGRMSGMEAGDYARGVKFDQVRIISADAQSVTVQVAGGGVGSDRVTGEVSVIDGAGARTKAGVAFFAGASAGAAAGFYSGVQLWNPAGSGKRIVVSRIFAGTAAGPSLMHVRSMTSALSVLDSSPSNKLIGGAASVSQVRKSSSEATIPGDLVMLFSMASSQKEAVELKEPVVLGDGFGLSVFVNAVNVTVTAAFELIEEAI